MVLGPEVIEALIRWRWVERDSADDKTAVERAVEAGLIDAEMAALLLFAQRVSRAEPLDQLYEKAKLDKALFYSGGPTAPHENRAKEFMQKYPGIAVLVTGSFSNVLNERIEKQMADNPRAIFLSPVASPPARPFVRLAVQARGKAGDRVVPRSTRLLLFTLTGGIFKDPPHPNAAKLYLTWFLAGEQQSRLGSFSSRVDVPPPEGFQPLASYKIAATHDRSRTSSERPREMDVPMVVEVIVG